jgi:hypothetical protein
MDFKEKCLARHKIIPINSIIEKDEHFKYLRCDIPHEADYTNVKCKGKKGKIVPVLN